MGKSIGIERSSSNKRPEPKEKWIKHYSSSHKILLVGEGDFSFALCLAKAFGSARNMVATSFERKGELLLKYSKVRKNLEKLQDDLGCKILHKVNAHTMSNHRFLSTIEFDRIVFNFPHAGFYGTEDSDEQIQLHKDLMKGFFASASCMLTDFGEIHVTHKTTHPFSTWGIKKLAKKERLVNVKEHEFYISDYPGYSNKRGDGNRSDESFPVGECCTFTFGKYWAMRQLQLQNCQIRKQLAKPQETHKQDGTHDDNGKFSNCNSRPSTQSSPSTVAPIRPRTKCSSPSTGAGSERVKSRQPFRGGSSSMDNQETHKQDGTHDDNGKFSNCNSRPSTQSSPSTVAPIRPRTEWRPSTGAGSEKMESRQPHKGSSSSMDNQETHKQDGTHDDIGKFNNNSSRPSTQSSPSTVAPIRTGTEWSSPSTGVRSEKVESRQPLRGGNSSMDNKETQKQDGTHDDNGNFSNCNLRPSTQTSPSTVAPIRPRTEWSSPSTGAGSERVESKQPFRGDGSSMDNQNNSMNFKHVAADSDSYSDSDSESNESSGSKSRNEVLPRGMLFWACLLILLCFVIGFISPD